MALEKSDKNPKYLIDTSALYPMLSKGIVLDSEKFSVSVLTEYELGNVLWKESQNKKFRNYSRVAQIFSEMIKDLKAYSIDSIQEVLKLALDRGLTFYDASYAYIAETRRLILITEDSELLKKTKKAISLDKLEV